MDNQEFQYTYSAKEHAEIQGIRKKYLPREESKMDLLRKLDRTPAEKAKTWAITLGIVGALILGGGMSLFMSDLGAALSLSGTAAMVVGIAVGVLGLVLVAMAYPMYNMVLKKQRRLIAPEILRLTDELMKQGIYQQ